MPKKSRDDFKAAFKTVKKPKPPTKDAKASKVAIDKALDKGDPDGTLAGLIDELVNSGERDYVVKLVAYKYAKHYEDGSEKRPTWATKFPADIFNDALAIVVPDGIDSALTKKTLARAMSSGGKEGTLTGKLLYDRDPDKMVDYLIEQISAAHGKGDAKLAKAWVESIPNNAETAAKLLSAALEKNDVAAVRVLAKDLAMVREPLPPLKEGEVSNTAREEPLDFPAIRDLARVKPKLFAKEVLPGLKANNSVMLQLISDENIRAVMKTQAPAEWKELVDATPMLQLFEGLEKKIKDKKLNTTDKVTDALFDMVVNNEGIDLAYYTNTFYTPGDMMLGPNEMQQNILNAQREMNPEGTPDGPASQCSMLTNTMQRMLGFSPGMKPKPTITQKEVPKMVMTKPLSSMKRGDKQIKGLLDKSFAGNVFTDTGAATGCVMFTGSDGLKAHTWLVVNGVAYDTVLGTKGDEVEAAVAEEFRWIKSDAFAKGNKGSFLIQVTDKAPTALAKKPKVDGNKMGFSTAYVLTKSPDTFLTDQEKIDFDLAKAKKADTEDDWKNKAGA